MAALRCWVACVCVQYAKVLHTAIPDSLAHHHASSCRYEVRLPLTQSLAIVKCSIAIVSWAFWVQMAVRAGGRIWDGVQMIPTEAAEPLTAARRAVRELLNKLAMGTMARGS